MIIFELDLDFKYPSTQQLNFIDELESIGIRLKSVSSATKVYFDNVEIDPSKVITIANPVSGTHYFKNDLGTQIKCVFIAKNSSINFQPNQPDMSDYYTKEETDESIEEAIEGIDFPEPKIPETSTIPQKGGMDGNAMLIYPTEGGVSTVLYSLHDDDIQNYEVEYSNVNGGVPVVFTEPELGLVIKGNNTLGTTVGETFNFPDKLLYCGIHYDHSAGPRNASVATGYDIVDGYVMATNSFFEGSALLIENIRGFINQEEFNLETMVIRNCGILAAPQSFNSINHLVIDGELKYISNIFFAQDARGYGYPPCQHITFTGKGFLKSELERGNLWMTEVVSAPSTTPFTFEFPDITFNEFVAWCNNNGIETASIYSDLFNGSAIAKLVFKDQTLTDVTQAKLDGAEPDLVATLADGTVLPCRTAGEAEGWREVIAGAVKLEIFNTEGGYPEVFSDSNCFQACTELKEVIDTRDTGTAYTFPGTLDSLTVARYEGLYGNNAKNTYITHIDPGTGYYLFDEDRVIDNVYFTNIESPSEVDNYLGMQNADAKIYFAGVLAATYSGFYHSLTWKNGFTGGGVD